MLQKLHYIIEHIAHKRHPRTGLGAAYVYGNVSCEGVSHDFRMWLNSPDKGHWQIIGPPAWRSPIPDFLKQSTFWSALEVRIDLLLRTINVWPTEQGRDGGARLAFNEIQIPADAAGKVFASFRPDMLEVPPPKWVELWTHIRNRVLYDPFFGVQGFDRKQVLDCLPVLERVFPASWVKGKYATASASSMTAPLDQNDPYWFPAYHLARTCCGALCVDPGWNYLADLAMSLAELAKTPGVDALKQKLAQHPGVIQQITLAAEFKRRGLLLQLEPPTGVGSYKNDLKIGAEHLAVDLEVKSLTSDRPGSRLRSEIKNKILQLPARPTHPIYLYAILAEKGFYNKDREDQFVSDALTCTAELPPQLAGIAVARTWLDSDGGRMHHSLIALYENEKSPMRADRDSLATLLTSGDEAPTYPVFGVPSLFAFEKPRDPICVTGAKEQSGAP